MENGTQVKPVLLAVKRFAVYATLQPIDVQERVVPHLKDLISGYLGRGNAFF